MDAAQKVIDAVFTIGLGRSDRIAPYAAYYRLDNGWPADLDAGRFFPLFEARVVAQTGIGGGSHNNDLELSIVETPAAFVPTGDKVRDAYLAWAGPAAQGEQRMIPVSGVPNLYHLVPVNPPVRPLNDARLRVRYPRKMPFRLELNDELGARLLEITSDPMGSPRHDVYVNFEKQEASVPTRLMGRPELEGFVVHDAEAVSGTWYGMAQKIERENPGSMREQLEEMAKLKTCQACLGISI